MGRSGNRRIRPKEVSTQNFNGGTVFEKLAASTSSMWKERGGPRERRSRKRTRQQRRELKGTKSCSYKSCLHTTNEEVKGRSGINITTASEPKGTDYFGIRGLKNNPKRDQSLKGGKKLRKRRKNKEMGKPSKTGFSCGGCRAREPTSCRKVVQGRGKESV